MVTGNIATNTTLTRFYLAGDTIVASDISDRFALDSVAVFALVSDGIFVVKRNPAWERDRRTRTSGMQVAQTMRKPGRVMLIAYSHQAIDHEERPPGLPPK